MGKATIEVGTVSHGTLRTQDLLRAFLAELRRVHPLAYDQIMSPGCGFSAFPSYADDDDTHEWWQSDDAALVGGPKKTPTRNRPRLREMSDALLS